MTDTFEKWLDELIQNPATGLTEARRRVLSIPRTDFAREVWKDCLKARKGKAAK
ncbi:MULTISPECIES: hypothetical protein [Serratia]|uniref:hypothetical protein n=1 Tax=Serratia TaxID=613 RepID=UPI000358374B|nr:MULTISPECIES: hypothetical protein [Serratia]AGQ31645.1 hypothetical protein M495_14655 [Serratia liquefaciens ATCC 27592]MDU3932264.1 hypothetical protein [Serratia liquefaciens]